MTGQDTKDYWRSRARSIYLYAVGELVAGLGKNANSLLDVGSGKGAYVDWFDWIPYRASVDIDIPYSSPTVVPVRADFMQWQPDRQYDLVTCLQVLEHIPDATGFAQKLLQVGEIVIISVPYKWKAGGNKTHVHDPVNKQKLLEWFGREPNYAFEVTEIMVESPRIIQVYERDSDLKWTSISKRRRLLDGGENYGRDNNP